MIALGVVVIALIAVSLHRYLGFTVLQVAVSILFALSAGCAQALTLHALGN